MQILGLGRIAHFLSKAIEPPSAQAIEHVIEMLRSFNALERHEEALTPLGYHLGSLPVDARIGKMMIFGCIFRCLDPILTIAAAISYRSPFVAPMEKREEADKAKQTFCNDKSDHITVLKAYKGWLRSREEKTERQYCEKHFLSRNALTMIADMKRQFAQLLSELGFVRKGVDARRMSRLPGDGVLLGTGLQANKHADNLRMVQAVLVAGLYPNVINVVEKGKDNKLMTKADGEVALHPTSVLFNEKSFASPYLIFFEKVKTSKVYVRDASMVTPYQLLLFGGDLDIQHERALVTLDQWLVFRAKAKTAVLMRDLRVELRKLLVQKIQNPDLDLSAAAETLIEAVSTLLASENAMPKTESMTTATGVVASA